LKEIALENYNKIASFIKSNEEHSCENSFVNLLLWQKAYKNQFKLFDDCFLLYSQSHNGELYRLPFCKNIEKGINKIFEFNNGVLPCFWAQDGARFEAFKKLFSDKYEFIEKRDAFDYVYNRSDLAELAGKKYHSKRNHIASFGKKYNWKYKTITKENTDEILECAEKWYSQNKEKFDKYMAVEKEGIKLLLENMEILNIKGGAISIGNNIVAFTLGSPINDKVFDIHIEKALKDYQEAYTVINREFAKNELSDYEFINREDDMGLEGLRKAKMSYKPAFMIKKYLCKPR